MKLVTQHLTHQCDTLFEGSRDDQLHPNEQDLLSQLPTAEKR